MRQDRNIKEKGHDPYDEGRKYSEGTYCPDCGAVYQQGRWVWPEKAVKDGEPLFCPACRRIRDDFPAGEVLFTGTYLENHGKEVLNLIQNIIDGAKERTPLKKVIELKQNRGEILVRLTDDHLARQIGDAVYRAYSGDLELKYSDEEKFVRLYWHRDE
ncbi:MAG TPA: ATPase [Deltaproteobacteria bacterium]|nr:ATPase [Deltaproteobacteria bacterium]